MALTGAQHAQIQNALLAAFNEAGLHQLALHELDADLDAIAGGDNTTEIVFNLVKWANQTGCVRKLIDGALRQNPTNPALQALAQAASKWRLDEPPPPPAPAPAPSSIPSQPGGLKLGSGVWIAAGFVLAALAIAVIFWPRPPQPPAPAPTATPETPTVTPAVTTSTPTIPTIPAVTATAPSAIAPAETPPVPTGAPEPLAVAVEPFTGCDEPNPATALHAQLQNQLRQSDAEATVQLTLLHAAGAAVEQPYAIVFGGSCVADGQVVYTADVPLVGDGRSERVAEPTHLELPWPDDTPPPKTLAALLIYHAKEGSYDPAALLGQEEAVWVEAPENGRLALYWLLGNALLDNPREAEEEAREQYGLALDLVATDPISKSLAAQLHNNRGYAYYEQAINVIETQDADRDIKRTLHLSATQEFSRAAELDPTYGMAWVNLGTVYMQLGDYEQALASCKQALAKSGDFAPAFVCIATIHYDENDLPATIEQSQFALKSNSQRALAHYLAGASYCMFDVKRARSSLLSFLEWYPSLSRWDKYQPLYDEALELLERIENTSSCFPSPSEIPS
jgi:tetratricopeptide (TPR) repeat protein